MSEFALHPEAFADLEEIRDYIASENPDADDRVLAEIFEAIRLLPRFPLTGHVRPDLTARPLRFQVVREYVIAYAPETSPLSILAVIYGRRNPRLIASILGGRK